MPWACLVGKRHETIAASGGEALWLIWAQQFVSLRFDGFLLSSSFFFTQLVLKNVLFVFGGFSPSKVSVFFFFFLMYLLYLFFLYCTVTLLTPAPVFAYSSQLPPSHPAAPPEHLKEPLAYMRKAQVSLSPLISVTPHLFFISLSDSFFFSPCWIRRCSPCFLIA